MLIAGKMIPGWSCDWAGVSFPFLTLRTGSDAGRIVFGRQTSDWAFIYTRFCDDDDGNVKMQASAITGHQVGEKKKKKKKKNEL